MGIGGCIMYYLWCRYRILFGCFIAVTLIACEKPIKQGNSTPEKSLGEDVFESQNITGQIESLAVNIPATASPGTFDQGVYDALGAAEIAYGGLLYDKWYVAAADAGAVTPVTAHPLWPTPAPPPVENSWRCKECHGWDYQGRDGIYGTDPAGIHFSDICGVLATANCPSNFTTPDTLWTFIHDGGTTPGIVNAADHAFADSLPDAEIYALTKFVMTIRAEAEAANAPADFIDSDPASATFKSVMGDQARGLLFYGLPSTFGGCSESCHGDDGALIDVSPPNELFIDAVAQDNPWEVLHKIRFGNPGTTPPMPGMAQYDFADFDFKAAVDVLSYVQTALGRSYTSGGRLYDNWVIETGSDATQVTPNPLLQLAPDQAAASSVSDVDGWRCVVCHGFDYEGGSFGFSNNLVELKVLNNWDSGKVFNILKNGYSAVDPATGALSIVHKYSDLLSDVALWDLAAFAEVRLADMHEFIRVDTGGIRAYKANFAEGEAIYNEQAIGTFATGTQLGCLTCHGVDGTLATRPDGTATDIFSLSWRDPFQFFHVLAFGSPRLPNAAADSFSPSLYDANVTGGHINDHEIADVVYYVQESLLTLSPAKVVEIQQSKLIGSGTP